MFFRLRLWVWGKDSRDEVSWSCAVCGHLTHSIPGMWAWLAWWPPGSSMAGSLVSLAPPPTWKPTTKSSHPSVAAQPPLSSSDSTRGCCTPLPSHQGSFQPLPFLTHVGPRAGVLPWESPPASPPLLFWACVPLAAPSLRGCEQSDQSSRMAGTFSQCPTWAEATQLENCQSSCSGPLPGKH